MFFDYHSMLLLLTSALNFSFGAIIYFHGAQKRVNKTFAAFAFALGLWPLTLFFYNTFPLSSALFWMKASYAAAMLIAAFFWLFACYFPEEKKISRLNFFSLLLATFALTALIFQKFFLVLKVIDESWGRNTFLDTRGYLFFTAYFVFYFFGALFLLWKKYRVNQGVIKNQIGNIFLSVFWAGSFGVFFNLILPSPLANNFRFIWLGPFFTFFIVLMTALAVARFQLMNIKVISTEILVIFINLFFLMQIFLTESKLDLLYYVVFFAAVLVFSLYLIKNVYLEVKQTEFIAAQTELLQKANEHLSVLDRAKSDFLSIVAHQLRTPLTVIQGYIALLKEGTYGKISKNVDKIFSAIDLNNKRLNQLVDEFLDITRLEEGRLQYLFKTVDMKKILRQVIERYGDEAENKKIKIHLYLPEEKIEISGDEEKLAHIFVHLVDDAIKYGENKDVEVKAKIEDEGVLVEVKDRGIGIAPADLPNLFVKFYRGVNAKAVDANGVGLGLYLCKQFAVAHKGIIWAESEGVGKGAAFNVWLPFK